MSETIALTDHFDESGLYEIRLKGHLNDRWIGWFGDAIITLEDNGNTLLICNVIDQAALHAADLACELFFADLRLQLHEAREALLLDLFRHRVRHQRGADYGRG